MLANSRDQLFPMLRKVGAFLAVVAFLGLPLQAQTVPTTEPEGAEARAQLTLEQVLAKYGAASGTNRVREFKSTKAIGRAVTMGMEAPFTRWTQRPNQMRLEIYVPGMTGIQAYDGETAWWYMPFMGHAAAEVMPPEMARMMAQGADFDGPLVDWKAKGHEVDLLGTEPHDGGTAYKIKITLNDGDVQTHWIDTETFLPVRISSPQQDIEFEEWKELDGIPYPATMVVMGDMGEQIIYVDEIEFNADVSNVKFGMQ